MQHHGRHSSNRWWWMDASRNPPFAGKKKLVNHATPLWHTTHRGNLSAIMCTAEEEEGEAGWNRYVHNEDERAVIRIGRDMH